MKFKIFAFTFLLFFTLHYHQVYCDIPVHCIKNQIVGQWTIEITKPTYYANPHENNCGHDEPDSPANSNIAGSDTFVPYETQVITLNGDDTISTNNGISGNWTMIYDEGFDLTMNNTKYTAFMYYQANDSSNSNDDSENYISDCGKTAVGWYHDFNNNLYACFRANKILAPGESTQVLLKIKKNTPIGHNYGLSNQKSNHKMLRLHSLGDDDTLKITKDFSDHNRVVRRLNSLNKSWVAAVPKDFHGVSVKELNLLAGRKSIKQDISKSQNSSSVHKKDRHHKLNNARCSDSTDVSDLPKEFIWAPEIVGPLREQNRCGSCYIFATTNMIASRLKIKYNEDVLLSVQHPLDCSFYNQGCQGGYPFLVNKFGSEFEFVPETCHPYQGTDGKCSNACDLKSLDKIYRVNNYYYVGGAYGRSNERCIMLELMNYGPLAISLEPTYDFMYYSGGIYKSVPETEWIRNHEPRPEWEKVDHSVLLIGWGEQDGEKYWVIKNTWGPTWGENGTAKVARGIDESAIESMAEAAHPYIVYNCQSPLRASANYADGDPQECFQTKQMSMFSNRQ